MKKIITVLWAVAALALTSACNFKTDFPTPATTDNAISVDLVFADPTTKSNGVGKENTINSVEYFFYTNVASNPVFSKRVENPTVTNNTYTINENAGVNGVPSLNNLFKDGKFEVYAVFNAPDLEDAPLATLQQTALDVTFAHQEDGDWVVTPDENLDPNNPHDKFFVMTGQKVINKAMSGDYANVQSEKTVNMKRVAAKVSVKLKIKQECEQSATVHWIPLLDDPTVIPAIKENVRIYMCNFVQNSLLSATNDTPVLPTTYTQADYRPYTLATGPNDRTSSNGYYVIESQQDFYTYPIEWEAGSDFEPYIKVVLPWRMREGFTTQRELYYKVMFPSTITKIEANKFYQLEVTLSMLGTEGEPTVTVEGYNAQVVDWVSDSSVSAAVSNAKYLSVEKEFSKFFTQNDGISFAASDMVYLDIKNVYQENLKTGNKEYVVKNSNIADDREDLGTATFIRDDDNRIIGLKVDDGNPDTSDNWIELGNAAHHMEVGHILNANLASQYLDVTPWVYEITMKLVDADASYDREVSFEQWPNLYIEEDPNSNNGATNNVGIFVNNHQGGSNTYPKGYVAGTGLITGTQYYDNDGTFNLGNVNGLTGDNTNPSMYIITISVSDSYDIGDPRASEENNFPDFWKAAGNYVLTQGYTSYESNWASAPGIEGGGNRRLQHYHPAASDASFKNMIAPKIRIASSYGVTSALSSRENAQLRCAGYQEDGIPAGRWRLPTLAEVKFISSLSALKRIPYLFANEDEDSSGFNTTTYYWTASGQIAVNNGAQTAQEPTTQNGTAYARCVYDEWFWGDAKTTRPVSNKKTFTWGDRAY